MAFRRAAVTLLVAFMAAFLPGAGYAFNDAKLKEEFKNIEDSVRGRMGVSVVNASTGDSFSYRGDEFFPMCSTFKVMLVAGVLNLSSQDAGIMDKKIDVRRRDMVVYSPVTEKHVSGAMTVRELCVAAIQESDNTAANLLMRLMGGPAGVTAFARSIGDEKFRVDRWEPDLNSCIPFDMRDGTTPSAMAKSLAKILIADALPAPQRETLVNWMLGNKTGAQRIRAGVPTATRVADRTGTGAYGVTNAVGVVWMPDGTPLALAIYYTDKREDAGSSNQLVADITRTIYMLYNQK